MSRKCSLMPCEMAHCKQSEVLRVVSFLRFGLEFSAFDMYAVTRKGKKVEAGMKKVIEGISLGMHGIRGNQCYWQHKIHP